MSRYQFDDLENDSGFADRSMQITQFVVRAFGFLLMIVGLWIGLKVINEAWSLYTEPANIERIAIAIEKGSNLDKSLSSVRSGEDSSGSEVNSALGFRLSYFAAWILAILLLMLIGRLAIAAVKTGGELALYDLHIKRFARQLVRDASNNITDS